MANQADNRQDQEENQSQELPVVHLDLDSFFVSVERLKDPSLNNKPVIIGGNSDRGVVASCSYEARKYGVHSAMPIKTARQLCSHGIYMPGDMESYSQYSQYITAMIAEEVPAFEKASIDEFYIDLSGMDRYFGCHPFAQQLRSQIMESSGLPLSMGLSANKTISKIATDEAKPNGEKVVPRGQEQDFLRPLEIQKLPMVGKVTHRFLKEMGIDTIGQLMDMPVDILQNALGKPGLTLWKRANGIDPSPITPYSERKSISKEKTFQHDTADIRELESVLLAMTEQLSYQLRSQEQMTACVAVKIRYTDFKTVTQQKKIPYTNREDTIFQVIKDLFHHCFQRRVLIRLIGVRFSHLVHANYQMDLFDATLKNVHLMEAMDQVRNKFGVDAVSRANGLFANRKNREKPDD